MIPPSTSTPSPKVGARPESQQQKNSSERRRSEQVSVLIVEDDEDTRKAVEIYLTANEFHVTSTSTSEQAMAVLPVLSPDVVLLDLGLPGMDGLELLRRMQMKGTTRKTQFIVASAWDEWIYEEHALTCGAVRYLEKPVSGEAIVAAIRDAVG